MKISLQARQFCCLLYLLLHVAAHFSAQWFEAMPGISIWYAPAGLALSLLLLLGPGYWPTVLVANVLTAYMGSGLPEWWAPLVFPGLLTANYTFWAWLGRRTLGAMILPDTPKRVAGFILLLLAAPAAAALLGTVAFNLISQGGGMEFGLSLTRWWVGDFCGLLTVVPVALVFAGPWVRDELKQGPLMAPQGKSWVTVLVQSVCLLLALVLVYSVEPLRRYNAFYICFLPLIWISLDHGLPGATLATLAVTMSGLVSMNLFGDGSQALVLNFLLFVVAVACVGLGLGTAVSTRNAMQERFLRAQKMESLGVLAGGIAHDFNNLLTVVLGNATLARLDTDEKSPVAGCLDQIETATKKASELCQQMLVYAGKAQTSLAQVDLNDLAARSVGLLSSSIPKQCRILLQTSGPAAKVRVDENQLRQVMITLLLNASEAIGQEEGRIIIRTLQRRFTRDELRHHFAEGSLPEGDYSVMEIEDNGCGMSREVLSRIFEPFFTTKFIGKGMGLAAVLGIVKSNHGGVAVRSEEGAGTCFQIVFPSVAGATPPPTGNTPSPTRTLHAPGTAHGLILVVDDDVGVRTIVARSLRSLGYEVLEAGDGVEAVELFKMQQERLSCVLSDVVMPRMDGAAAYLQMKSINPRIPVALMSGYDATRRLESLGSQQPPVFISKPFDLQKLGQRLEGLIAASPNARGA